MPSLSLKRLLPRAEAKQLLASFTHLLPGDFAALLAADGSQVGQQGSAGLPDGWPACAAKTLPGDAAGGPPDRPTSLDGAAFYPLVVDGQRLGWLVVDRPSPAAAALQSLLRQLLSERAVARRLARETLARYREVNLLYRLAGRFGASFDVDEILRLALAEAQRLIRADCGLVWLADGQGQAQPVEFGPPETVRALEIFSGGRLQTDPLLSEPAIVTGRDNLGEGLAAVLYAPLRVRGDLLGLLALAKTAGQPEFSAGDEKLLAALGGQAAGAIEKAMLHRQDLQHQQIAHELAIGQRIQRSLLPKHMPEIPGWEFATCYRAANQVGGDFYDIFPLPGETDCGGISRYGLAIADVTGKGIPAALMMAFAQGIMRSTAFVRPAPGDVLSQANQSILQSSHSGLMVSTFYGVLDPCIGDLSYASGGHEWPVLYRAAAGECQALFSDQSLLLGIQANHRYLEFTTRMEPGDLLLMYTDGVTEARSPGGDFFTEERLYTLVTQYAGQGCSVLVAALDEALKQFTAGADPSDDITLLAIQRMS